MNQLTERKTKRPSTLYKYRSCDNNFHLNLLKKRQIYFAAPNEFNDPFDGRIPTRGDLVTYEECLEWNLNTINIVHSDKDQNEVRKYAKIVTDAKQLMHPDKLNKESEEQLDGWTNRIGLISLSEEPDNILLWSHYGNNHQGFSVGLDTNSLIEDYDFDFIEAINYQSEYPLISGLEPTNEQFYKKFFYKSSLWEYEREWRVSKNHIGNRVCTLMPESFVEIVFGCKSRDKDIEKLMKIGAKNLGNHVRYFKAEKAEGRFELKLTEL